MLSTTRRCFRFISPVVATLLLLATTPRPGAAAPPPRPPAASIPIVGMVTGGGTFSGVLSITSFAVRNGNVVALGTVSGTVTNAAGAATSALAAVVVPLAITRTTCDVLHLDVGPIALDILGLHVELSRVVLDISAEAGGRSLLGELR